MELLNYLLLRLLCRLPALTLRYWCNSRIRNVHGSTNTLPALLEKGKCILIVHGPELIIIIVAPQLPNSVQLATRHNKSLHKV